LDILATYSFVVLKFYKHWWQHCSVAARIQIKHNHQIQRLVL